LPKTSDTFLFTKRRRLLRTMRRLSTWRRGL
jgi:hypothetical protein